jgi:capsular polysaccharide export protein
MISLLELAGNAHHNILLLQGPVGPFFRYLAHDLKVSGAQVFKINFNGGDALFYPFNAINYRGSLHEWPSFLERFIKEHAIDLILLFGDCRPIHQAAHATALRCQIEVGVFEEGYIRPDYVTLERYGVNGNSQLMGNIKNFDTYHENVPPAAFKVPFPFYHAMVWAMLYNTAGTLFKSFFKNYKHHRDLHIFDGILWLKSFWRKWMFSIEEYGVEERLTKELSQQFFLVPLQVGNDAQIHSHSDYRSNREFIKLVLKSFAEHAPKDCYLVIKQHPLERGYSKHGSFIQRFAGWLGIKNRVLYIHDQHLPALFQHTRGVVVINSTVGLSAIHQGRPVIAMGQAIYGLPGLTFQGALDKFWHKAETPTPHVSKAFRNQLIHLTQINGNFYRRLPESNFRSGLIWRSKE